VKNWSEIVMYGGFNDKRDFKDFKRMMVENCWTTNVEERK